MIHAGLDRVERPAVAKAGLVRRLAESALRVGAARKCGTISKVPVSFRDGCRRALLHRTRLVCAVGVSLWSAVGIGSQKVPTGPLPQALRAHLKNERLDIVTSIRGLPLGVRDGLQTLFGSQALDIAEPGNPFQATDVVGSPKLPSRRLVAAGCSTDHCLVYYERGGVAHTWQVALFHWTPAATRLEWGAAAEGGLVTIADVKSAVLSGAIKGPNRVW